MMKLGMNLVWKTAENQQDANAAEVTPTKEEHHLNSPYHPAN